LVELLANASGLESLRRVVHAQPLLLEALLMTAMDK